MLYYTRYIMASTCDTPSAPINISGNPISTCDLKCKYNYNYKDSTSTVTINPSYLSLSYENSYPEPVTYNSNGYPVSEVRIYSPSIHTYSNNSVAGEMIILHNGSYGKLAVCIPLKAGGQEKTKSSLDLAKIIYTASKYARGNSNNSAVLQKTINLNNFIPNKKFYTYKGVFPFTSCNDEYNCIVFSPQDNAFIDIPVALLKSLKTIISPHSINVGSNINYYVNNKGPTQYESNTNNDEIYIDCKPISDDGSKVIGEEEVKGKISSSNPFTERNFRKILNNPLLILILAAILFFIIIKLFGLISRYIFSSKTKAQTPTSV